MTEARRLLERCAPYIDGRVTAFSHETDRQALNRTRAELLRDIDAYLARPMTKCGEDYLTEEERGWYDRCESSVEDWPSDDSDTVEAMARHLRSLAESRAREGELVAALQKYGAHGSGCLAISWKRGDNEYRCDCGLDAAVAAALADLSPAAAAREPIT